jgi:hypothetical protein
MGHVWALNTTEVQDTFSFITNKTGTFVLSAEILTSYTPKPSAQMEFQVSLAPDTKILILAFSYIFSLGLIGKGVSLQTQKVKFKKDKKTGLFYIFFGLIIVIAVSLVVLPQYISYISNIPNQTEIQMPTSYTGDVRIFLMIPSFFALALILKGLSYQKEILKRERGWFLITMGIILIIVVILLMIYLSNIA